MPYNAATNNMYNTNKRKSDSIAVKNELEDHFRVKNAYLLYGITPKGDIIAISSARMENGETANEIINKFKQAYSKEDVFAFLLVEYLEAIDLLRLGKGNCIKLLGQKEFFIGNE